MKFKIFNIICGLLFLVQFQIIAQDTLYTDDIDEEFEYQYVEDEYEDYEEEEEDDSHVLLLGFDLNLVKPVNHFFEIDQSHRIGFNLNFLVQLYQEKSLMLGFDFGFNKMDEITGQYLDVIDDDLRKIDWATNTTLWMFLVDMRYYFNVNLWIFEPYIDGLIGSNMISTYTRYSDPHDDEYSDSEKHRITFSPSYGMALGTHIYLNTSTYLDLRTKYIFGAPASYYQLDEPSDISYNGIDNFDYTNSQTSVLYYSIGVVLKY